MLFKRSPILRSATTPGEWTSKYGPTLKSRLQIRGTPIAPLTRYTTLAAGFGATALVAVAFLMEEVPVVRKDIFLNIPIIGSYWDRSIAPEDNPF